MEDKFGIKIKYPDRSCSECIKNPCFTGKEKTICDMAKYGCVDYKKNDK